MPAPQTLVRELRRAQRLADPDPRPRHHGAGLVSGRHLGVRLDRRRAPEGDRVLRPRPGRLDAPRVDGGDWSAYWYNGVIVGSEIARGLDILRAHAERPHLAERDRRGEVGAPRRAQRAGPAEVRLAAELRAGARVRRPARPLERPERRPDHRDPPGPGRGRESIRRPAPDALTQLATQFDGDAGGAADGAKVRKLADAVRQLSSAPMASAGTAKTAAGY